MSDVRTVLEFRYTLKMLDLFMLEICQNIVNEASPYSLYRDDTRFKLKEILRKMKRDEFEQCFENNFEEIVTLLTNDSLNQTESLLYLMRMIAVAEENYETKIQEKSIQRTGAEVDLFLTPFLVYWVIFDLLNFWSGYHPSRNYEDPEGPVTYLNPYIAIDGLDVTDFVENIDSQNWLEHLFLRTYSLNNNRNHFPVILTTTKSYFFSKDLVERTNIPLANISIIDLQSYRDFCITIK